MSDIVKSLIETSMSRLKNPFIGSFIFSWLIWNWKVVLLITSFDLKANFRIVLIEKLFYFEDILGLLWVLGISLIFPALTAYLLVTFFPYFYKWLEKNHLNPVETDRLKGRTEVIQEKVRLEKINTEYENLVELKDQLEKMTEASNKASQTITEKVGEIAKLNRKIEELSTQRSSELKKAEEFDEVEKEMLEAKKVLKDKQEELQISINDNLEMEEKLKVLDEKYNTEIQKVKDAYEILREEKKLIRIEKKNLELIIRKLHGSQEEPFNNILARLNEKLYGKNDWLPEHEKIKDDILSIIKQSLAYKRANSLVGAREFSDLFDQVLSIENLMELKNFYKYLKNLPIKTKDLALTKAYEELYKRIPKEPK